MTDLSKRPNGRSSRNASLISSIMRTRAKNDAVVERNAGFKCKSRNKTPQCAKQLHTKPTRAKFDAEIQRKRFSFTFR